MSKPKKKSERVIDKERRRKSEDDSIWLFGLHAVRDAILNPKRQKLKLVVTPNAAVRLEDCLKQSPVEPQIVEPRNFKVPLDAGSVHQGAAIQVKPLVWGSVSEVCAPNNENPRVVLLDRVSDPHNVGAILRSAEVLGARAVIAPRRHAAPETGALAKTASGALERQPYLRVPNLANAMSALQQMGYILIGLDGTADETINGFMDISGDVPIGLVLGAEGPGLRELTQKTCDVLAKIDFPGGFGSLNVSNAAAVALYETTRKR